MNKTRPEAKALVEELKPLVKDADCGVVVCVPFTNLETVLEAAKGSNIKVGAQNCHFEKSGAFTGEVSADMLVEMGVEYVVIGHSERRQYFGETDITVNKRTIAALEAGLNVILCVGEMLEDRELGITEELVAMQTKIALNGVDKADLAKVISHMSRYGLSEPEKPLPQSKLTKFAVSSATQLQKSMIKPRQML